MTDILLFQENDGGEIDVIDGFVGLTDGLESAVYLSMFGGDKWFANDLQEEEAAKITSTTGLAIKNNPPSSAGLLAVEDAAKIDLDWLTTNNIASAVDAEASLFGATLTLIITIRYDNDEAVTLNYELNWEKARGRT